MWQGYSIILFTMVCDIGIINVIKFTRRDNMKKIVCLTITAILIFNSVLSVLGAKPDYEVASVRDYSTAEKYATKLKTLGLFKGVSDVEFDLGRAPTRTEAVVMLIRFLGKESEAVDAKYTHPFKDVPQWADAYIGYAYKHNLTNGISDVEFGSDISAGANIYLTFVLRALGYSDKDGADFKWDNPYELSNTVKILDETVNTSEFLRADAVIVSYNALNVKVKNEDVLLSEKLIKNGAFTEDEYMTVIENDKNASNVLDGKKIIFVGNSYTYYGRAVIVKSQKVLTQQERSKDRGFFYQLCKSKGIDVSVTNWTFGGHTLEDMFIECKANRGCDGVDHKSYLTDRNFDYVVIQQGKDVPLNNLDLVMNFFRSANPDVKFVFLVQSQAHIAQYSWLPEIKDVAKKAIIVDWGKVVYDIMMGNVSIPGAKETYNKNSFIISKSAKDGYHPNMLTGYITALMTYCTITGDSAVGMDYSFCNDSSVHKGFDFAEFISTQYIYDGATTNFPEIFASPSDMNGIQQIIDKYILEKHYLNY